jgi:lysophospholipase L1-like esterase
MRFNLTLPRPVLRLVLVLAAGFCLHAPAQAAPDHWLKEIDQLTAHDATNPPPSGAVLFVGSSSIRLWTTVAQDFPNVPVINRGFGGSELADSVFYADRIVIPYHPRMVVLFAGTNDIWSGKSAETVAADFKAFRAKLHAALPETKLLFLAINYSPSRTRVQPVMQAANRLIAADCATDPRCTFVDVCTPMLDAAGLPQPEFFREDMLHMKPSGYAIWTRVLAPYLKP